MTDGSDEEVGAVEMPGPADIESAMQREWECAKTLDEKALSNITLAQERDKKNYRKRIEKGAISFSLQLGELVLLKNSRKDTRKGGRLEKTWMGPYRCDSHSLKYCRKPLLLSR